MDHQWRAPPLPIHGKICPLCSTSHFPFCPPNHNSSFPPNLDRMHMQTPSPASSYTMLDPSHAPRYWESNPNFNATHSQYHIQPPRDLANANYTRGPHLNQRFDYGANAIGMGSDYSLNDRSSKRLKMDGTHLASYATDAYLNPSMPSAGDDERILKLIHDHGGALNGTAPSGQDHYPSFYETSANHASNLPNGYHLNSQPGHLHTQSYGYLNTSYGPNEASGEKLYSHTFQHPHYVRRANTVEEIHSLGCHAPPQTMDGCQVPGSYPSFSASSQYSIPQNGSHYPPTEEIDTWPPLPTSPPPPLPSDTPGHWITHPKHSPAPCKMSSSLFPVDSSSSKFAHSSYPPVPEAHSLAPSHHHNSQSVHSSSGLFPKDSHGPQTAMYQHIVQDQPVLSKYNVSDKPKIIDAISLFKLPNRDRRPDHFVIILRGLPGSGKSYLARMLRDLEIEHGGKAPRIHSMDDYFMTEVDKVEENETSVRGKKPVLKKVLEYCYEPEMEEAYRSSMLKAFKKTLDEGSFTIVIVDDRNLRVADFTQFWATAKRSGYEVYLLETSYKDPVGCTARNIHGFTRDAVEKMAELWEEAPPLYLQLDAKSLLHGDDSKESTIQEVDMDMDEEDLDKGSFELEETKQENVIVKTLEEIGYDGSKDKKTQEAEADHPDEEIKDLRSSKWSGDLDADNIKGSDNARGKSAAISGLFKAYGKEGKSVRWGDQVPNTGFSIGAMKKANVTSLIIGPGSGYNLKSNPLRVEESKAIAEKNGDRKKHNIFEEHLRAEKESFKAVFDRRRQRIGGLDQEED